MKLKHKLCQLICQVPMVLFLVILTVSASKDTRNIDNGVVIGGRSPF